MSRKLSTANPYMRDPVQRERTVLNSVASSSAIEGIHTPFRQPSSGTAKLAATPKVGKSRKSSITRG